MLRALAFWLAASAAAQMAMQSKSLLLGNVLIFIPYRKQSLCLKRGNPKDG